MSSPSRKQKKNGKSSTKVIDLGELAKDLKPGEMIHYSDDIYIIPMFVLDPPEPIKKTGKTKSRKKHR